MLYSHLVYFLCEYVTLFSSKAKNCKYFYLYVFCSLTNGLTDKIIIEQMRINKTTFYKKKSDFYLKQPPRKSCFFISTFLPFIALPAERRTKYLQNRCSFLRGICTKKYRIILERYLNQGPRKSRLTYVQMDRQTDICFYRVALLLTNSDISYFIQKKIDVLKVYNDNIFNQIKLLTNFHCSKSMFEKKTETKEMDEMLKTMIKFIFKTNFDKSELR